MISIKFFLIAYLSISLTANVINSKKVVCYYTNWAQYRSAAGKYLPEDIDPYLCTHVIYSFAKLDAQYELAPYEWNDESTEWSKGMYERTIDLKAINPSLKVLLAVGGWNHGSATFSNMVTDAALRQKFVSTAVTFLNKNKFDGLDLDWEYPASRAGSRPSDKQLFTSLIRELKAAFVADGLILTAAVSAGETTIDNGYEVSQISQYLDFINLMAYDLHGSWDPNLGFNAALYDTDTKNVDYAVQYWISLGASPEKLILGMGSYGRSFKMCGSSSTPGSCANGAGSAGRLTLEPGFMSYYEICENIRVNGWAEAYDSDRQVPYAFKGDQWVGYDNVKSIQLKAQYALSKGLGGVMFWALDLDDYKGTFCGEGTYPLIRAAKSALEDELEITTTLSNTTTASTTTSRTITTAGTTTASTTTSSTTTDRTTTTVGTTPANTSTSITTTDRTTNTIETNDITQTSTEPNSLCFRGDGFYAESGCKTYYRCVYSGTVWETFHKYACQDGLLFDTNFNYCNWADQVTCQDMILPTTTIASTTTVAPANEGCFRGDGFYPEPGCQAYFQCVYSGTVWETSYRYTCHDGLLFDAKLNYCNWAKWVKCSA